MVQGLYLLGFFLVTYVFETVVFHKSVPDKVKKQHECTLAFIFLKKIRKKIQLTKNRNWPLQEFWEEEQNPYDLTLYVESSLNLTDEFSLEDEQVSYTFQVLLFQI